MLHRAVRNTFDKFRLCPIAASLPLPRLQSLTRRCSGRGSASAVVPSNLCSAGRSAELGLRPQNRPAPVVTARGDYSCPLAFPARPAEPSCMRSRSSLRIASSVQSAARSFNFRWRRSHTLLVRPHLDLRTPHNSPRTRESARGHRESAPVGGRPRLRSRYPEVRPARRA